MILEERYIRIQVPMINLVYYVRQSCFHVCQIHDHASDFVDLNNISRTININVSSLPLPSP